MKKKYPSIISLLIAILLLLSGQLNAQSICPTPTSLIATNTSATGTVLYLGTTNATTGVYNIRYHSANSTAWITLSNIKIPYQLGNLSCNTGYEWQAQQVCTGPTGTTLTTLSDWSASATFTTSACPVLCPVPTGLSTTSISATAAALNWVNSPATPNYYSNIRYRSISSTTWITVTATAMPYQLSNLTCNTAYEWQVQQICSSSAGTTAVSDWSTSATFTTSACPIVCPVPTNLIVTNTSATGTVLYLGTTNATTGTYNVRYHSANSTAWITLSNIKIPYQLGNLSCNTGYEWQAQLVCSTVAGSTNALSDWSASATFTTSACPVLCPVPTGLSTTSISATAAALNWVNSPATPNYYSNIRYRSISSTTWITVTATAMPYQLSNLTCNTGYEWQIQQICSTVAGSTNAVSDWSASATFTTLACPIVCPVPTGLLTTDINNTSAVLSWDPIRGASAYLIRYKQNGKTTTYTTLTSTLNRIRIGGLNTSTSYIWQVQAVCSSTSAIGSLTTWSATAQFSTPYVLLFPNPTRSVTKINYSLATNSKVRVSLLNYFGKEVLHLNEGIQNEGNHTLDIDCSSLQPGIYFVELTLGTNTTMSKLVISR